MVNILLSLKTRLMEKFNNYVWLDTTFRLDIPLCMSYNNEDSVIPYIENHPWKKSFKNYLLCHSLRENYHDSGNLI